jgi:hypothetical protein
MSKPETRMRALTAYKLKRLFALLLVLFFALDVVAIAQDKEAISPSQASVAKQDQTSFSQQELDQMLAPIALYPDQLLSQILMASTYPVEVVEAARWSRSNSGLKGEDAVKAVQHKNWDPSVKSLVAFPQILQMMDEKLEWTERLGEAFLAQKSQVMDTVQNLRQKAYAAGNLKSGDKIVVVQQGQTIVLEPAEPDVIYVPYYDSNVVYGAWWWPAYPPVYWAPWPGYYTGPVFAWGVGIIVTTHFFFGDFDWDRHRVRVINTRNFYYKPGKHIEKGTKLPANAIPRVWQHNPYHRRGEPFKNEELRHQYGRKSRVPEKQHGFSGSERSGNGGQGDFSGQRPGNFPHGRTDGHK